MAKKHPQKPANLIAQNKKAGHDYNILETFEAGLVLTGTEIKSVRKGKISLRDGFARVRKGEAYLEHKKEIAKIGALTKDKGITIVPLRVYLKHGFAKVLIGVGEGKREYDKRETLKRKEQDREMARALRKR